MRESSATYDARSIIRALRQIADEQDAATDAFDTRAGSVLLREAADALAALSETAKPMPTEQEIATYRDTFRAELDKNMNNSSASPSTDAHRIALRRFVEGRNNG